MSHKLKPLFIGDVEVKVPIVQGGMGARVSMAPLAAAVANCGGAGTIASVGLGNDDLGNTSEFAKFAKEGLKKEIRLAKKLSKGVIGVNIMFALTNYEDLVRTSVEENADFIVSGAGLPLNLPELTKGSPIKLIPIVSSARAADIIIKTWKRRYDRLPDAVLVEGPMAGGHLGFKPEEIKTSLLENIVSDVIETVGKYQEKYNRNIPVIAAGGLFDGKDIAKFLKLGAQGVQLGTRFVATNECSISEKFKKLYIKARDEDTVIIKSPVGLPGRAIKNKFIDRIIRGEKILVKCGYKCLKTCKPKEVPYCIAKALLNAVEGNVDEAVIFAGSNVSKINKIVSVKELMDELVAETIKELE